jgi:hypothetical protein
MADRTLGEIRAALIGMANDASDADTIIAAANAQADLLMAVSAIGSCVELIAAEYGQLSASGLDVSRGIAAVDRLRAVVGAAGVEAGAIRGAA